MVDKNLPLRSLYLDLNSYFASVEQQLDPKLRGKPVAVIPTDTNATSVIAASAEAKVYGIKCGTNVGEAKLRCPDLVTIKGNHREYVLFHDRVKEAAETVLPIDKVCSIDEMRFVLLGSESSPAVATQLAYQMKKALREQVGDCITGSIGIAPNHFLAKLATDMKKPDGLIILQKDDLPGRLFDLKLMDFCGINRRTKVRLNAAGIFTGKDLTLASKEELVRAFGGVVGERFYYNLKGYQSQDDNETGKSLGHSHVLPPELRTDSGCREVLMRLLHKASARLRANQLWASHMSVHVKGMGISWSDDTSLPPTQDSVTMTERFLALWERRKFERPLQVGVTFTGLLKSDQVTPSLFDQTLERAEFSSAVDRMNKRFGKHKVFLASIEKAKHTAEEKIAFQKTWLFDEGQYEDLYPDTFRGGAAFNG